MVVIKFAKRENLAEALGLLATRFCGRVFRSGEVIVPEEALAALALENFSFTVIGRASYDEVAALRTQLSRASR